jgi:hypothetical protein
MLRLARPEVLFNKLKLPLLIIFYHVSAAGLVLLATLIDRSELTKEKKEYCLKLLCLSKGTKRIHLCVRDLDQKNFLLTPQDMVTLGRHFFEIAMIIQ